MRGAPCTIWRDSSEPIEPPAPVTSTALPRTQRVQQLRQRRDRIAPQQIFDRDVARVRDGLPFDEVGQIRNQSDVYRERLQKLDDAFAVGRGSRTAPRRALRAPAYRSAAPATTRGAYT